MTDKIVVARRGENGQLLVLFALLIPVFMGLLILMIDIGGAVITFNRAQIALDSAAFSAAQAIDLSEFYTSNQVILNQSKAAGNAGTFASINSRGSVRVTGIYTDRERVWVLGTMEYETVFGGALGVGTITANMIASAVPGYGVDWRGQ